MISSSVQWMIEAKCVSVGLAPPPQKTNSISPSIYDTVEPIGFGSGLREHRNGQQHRSTMGRSSGAPKLQRGRHYSLLGCSIVCISCLPQAVGT
jgi:hypothetical protein